MDYIITVFPTMYRRYLVTDVKSTAEAWDKYYTELLDPIGDEESLGNDDEVEIELLTPDLRELYGLDQVQGE